jgi:phospholipid N-methyltransferase
MTKLSRGLRGRALFLRSMLGHPGRVGAVWPTSRRAVDDLLDMAELSRARTVVEFGAGTGVYTEGILRRLPRDGRLLSFEVDGALAAAVSERFPDPRLAVIHASAERVAEYLGGDRADVVVSSVPFTTLSESVRRRILLAARDVLKPGGTLLVLQYSGFVRPELERLFPTVRRRFSPLNLPPAVLFACEAPGPGAPGREP